MNRIEMVFFDAGGGHRSAATSLQAVSQSQGRPWDISLLNLQERLDSIDIARRLTGIRIQDIYNVMLKKGWTLGSAELLRVLQFFVRCFHSQTVRLLEDIWKEREPDLVASVVPHFNRALCESFHNVFPGRPFVTILTDFADYPPHFWMEQQEQFFICGTEQAVAQARRLGHAEDHVFRASGMILNPRFYQPLEYDRRAEREQLGLLPDLPTGLVLFGGQGSEAIVEIAERLDRSGLAVQLILICGRNEKLAQKLRRQKMQIPTFVEGFTREVPYYMHLSDFFIGKPGPGSISEALDMRLPVIVECNAWTLPQERYNAEWIRTKEVGLVVPNFRDVVAAVAELLQPLALARYQKNAAACKNRAVFEIPEILQQILDRTPLSTASPARFETSCKQQPAGTLSLENQTD